MSLLYVDLYYHYEKTTKAHQLAGDEPRNTIHGTSTIVYIMSPPCITTYPLKARRTLASLSFLGFGVFPPFPTCLYSCSYWTHVLPGSTVWWLEGGKTRCI